MRRELNMDGDQYRDLLRMLNEAIYKYAEQQGIDLNDTEKLIETCNSMQKIKLGKETTEILLDGIMHYEVGDQRVLKFIDLEGISFADRGVRRVDFRGTNADVDPQTVVDKNIEGANFEGIDMSGKCFDGCLICHANLSYTNAAINPQKVYKKDMSFSNYSGIIFPVTTIFKDVDVRGSTFTTDGIERTMDINEDNFIGSIYDETTTLDGVPLTDLIAKNEDTTTIGTK